MIIFIDEGGHFTPSAGISVLCSLSIPHSLLDAARATLADLTGRWPRKGGELKGGLLNKWHLTALTTALFQHDAILQCIGTDVSLEDQEQIASHKRRQCEGITKHLLPTHPADLREQVTALRATLERMPNQLYVQFVLLSDLVLTTAERDAMYFAQRRPSELERFEWVIDAKDPKRVTVQEEWWRQTLGPLGESKSRQRPFGRIDDPAFDYSYFDKIYRFEKELWWPDRPRERVNGIDVAKLISGSVSFSDSRSDILLQAIDILANFMRRSMNGEIEDTDVYRQLGRLQILTKRGGSLQAMEFASFSNRPRYRKGLGKIAGIMTRQGRSMLLRRTDKQPKLTA